MCRNRWPPLASGFMCIPNEWLTVSRLQTSDSSACERSLFRSDCVQPAEHFSARRRLSCFLFNPPFSLQVCDCDRAARAVWPPAWVDDGHSGLTDRDVLSAHKVKHFCPEPNKRHFLVVLACSSERTWLIFKGKKMGAAARRRLTQVKLTRLTCAA